MHEPVYPEMGDRVRHRTTLRYGTVEDVWTPDCDKVPEWADEDGDEDVLVMFAGEREPKRQRLGDLDPVSVAERVALVAPMLVALALGLRVDARGETWAMSDDLDLLAVRRRMIGDVDAGEVGLRPLGDFGFGATVRLLEDVHPDHRTELLANKVLNEMRRGGGR